MSKPHPPFRTGNAREGDAESELRQHRRECSQCRRARFAYESYIVSLMCPVGKHLTNKLGLRKEGEK